MACDAARVQIDSHWTNTAAAGGNGKAVLQTRTERRTDAANLTKATARINKPRAGRRGCLSSQLRQQSLCRNVVLTRGVSQHRATIITLPKRIIRFPNFYMYCTLAIKAALFNQQKMSAMKQLNFFPIALYIANIYVNYYFCHSVLLLSSTMHFLLNLHNISMAYYFRNRENLLLDIYFFGHLIFNILLQHISGILFLIQPFSVRNQSREHKFIWIVIYFCFISCCHTFPVSFLRQLFFK